MSTHETIAYTEGDDRFDAVIARPETTGPHPTVLICHAWAGHGGHEEDRATRLAKLGYVGAAIDLYGVGKRGTDKDSCAALMRTLTDDPPLLRRRLTAAYQAVRTLDGVETPKPTTRGSGPSTTRTPIVDRGAR